MKIFLDKRCIINLCFLFLYLSSAFATATIVGKHRRLLIINSYNESAPWSQELITPILLQTSPIEDITADVVHMNGTFIRNDSLYIRMENGIFERFQDKKPDYLVHIRRFDKSKVVLRLQVNQRRCDGIGNVYRTSGEIIFPWSIRVFVADQYYWNISPLTQNTFP